MTALIPDKPGPCAARNAEDVACPRIEYSLTGADVHDRTAGFLKQVDGALFVRPKFSAWRHRARRPVSSGLVLTGNGNRERADESYEHECARPNDAASARL